MSHTIWSHWMWSIAQNNILQLSISALQLKLITPPVVQMYCISVFSILLWVIVESLVWHWTFAWNPEKGNNLKVLVENCFSQCSMCIGWWHVICWVHSLYSQGILIVLWSSIQPESPCNLLKPLKNCVASNWQLNIIFEYIGMFAF